MLFGGIWCWLWSQINTLAVSSSNGSGVVEIGKDVNTLLCRAPTPTVEENGADIVVVNFEFSFKEYTKDLHRGCNYAKHRFDII